jgi:arylformamidase
MAYFDLTHLMHSGMPVYPGKNQPFIEQTAFLKEDGYNETRIEIDSHTGTHMDAPAHMLANGKTLDEYPVSRFSGHATVIRIPSQNHLIELPFLKVHAEEINNSDFVLFDTGWSRLWGKDEYLNSYPVLTAEAAQWLVGNNLKGIGMDTISVDPMESATWPVHHILFDADLVIIENLLFPQDKEFLSGLFHCFPIYYINADGSPVRAVLNTL